MGFFQRVKAILFSPKTEWPVIEREPLDVAYVMTHYVAVLAFIPAIAGFVGGSVIGVTLPQVGVVRAPVFFGMMSAVIGYVLSFVIVYVVATIIDTLAPTFGGVKNFPSALKLAVYSSTPAWLAGVFIVLPGLTFMTALGLFGFYLLWVGLPVLMKSPPERTTVYTASVVACTIFVAVLLGLLQTTIAMLLGVI
jgi:hypothetical protein